MSEAVLTAERLRELLLDLEQSQLRERELRGQSEALLACVKALTEATTPEEVFTRLLDALREPLAFEHAFVLRSARERKMLHATAATNPIFLGSRWPIGTGFARILQAGRVVVHLDTSLVGEWKTQSDAIRASAGSAICIPLRGSAETALLVCTRSEAKSFQPAQEQMAKRFQPLATQALRDAERVAQIERANRNMRLVLDSVDQGLLAIGRDGIIVGETSGAIQSWFGAVEPGTKLSALIGRVCPEEEASFEMGWDQVAEDLLPLEASLECLPQRIVVGSQTLAVQFRPVGSVDAWTHMLVVVSDVTAEMERERAEERRGQLAAVVARIVQDRAGFQCFWDEANAIIDALAGGESDRVKQLRLLHTLKGNAACVGLGSVARACHELEERAREDSLGADGFAGLADRWRSLVEEVGPLLAVKTAPIAISEEEHRWLMDSLQRSAVPMEVAGTVASWVEERAEIPLGRLADHARGLAQRLDKPDLEVRIVDEGVRLEAARFRPLFSALVHAVRNAIDHGIEPPEAREAAGKRRAGLLTLRAGRAHEAVVISVEDDGQGIAWAKIAEKAASLGAPHATHEDLVEALLTDGVSTREEVTELSGRGVGMSALRASVASLGGTIAIESTLGRGTIVRCTLPRHAPISGRTPVRRSAAA